MLHKRCKQSSPVCLPISLTIFLSASASASAHASASACLPHACLMYRILNLGSNLRPATELGNLSLAGKTEETLSMDNALFNS